MALHRFFSGTKSDPVRGSGLDGTHLSTLIKDKWFLFFCVASIAALIGNTKLVYELFFYPDESIISASFSFAAGDGRGRVSDRLFTWAVISWVMGFSAFAAIIYFLNHRILRPISVVCGTVEEMAKGNLATTALIHHGSHLTGLASAVNDLSVNFQEILLLTGTSIGNSRERLEIIDKLLRKNELSATDLSRIREELDNLNADIDLLEYMVKQFQLYRTEFDGRKVISSN